MSKKLYRVSYDSWLGATAIVFADNGKDAIRIVDADEPITDLEHVEVEELPSDGVIYRDNGDY